MSDDNDHALLDQYTRRRSHDAFARIVRRYAGMVYSSARRQLRDPALADDVTQAVFVALAQKAPALPATVVLPGWLLTATRHLASNANVVESRRKHHEKSAAAMAKTVQDDPVASEAADAWERVAPALDEAMAELPEPHLDALVLRFFGNQSVRQVAEALRITEDAAKQRISRAVRHLRAALAARGVAVPSVELAGALSAHAAGAAPAALVQSVVAAAAKSPALLAWLKSVLSPAARAARRPWPAAAAGTALVGAIVLIALAVQARKAAGPAAGGIVYAVLGTDDVLVTKDRPYRKIPQGELWFDVYRPKGAAPEAGWPVVVLIHGGPVAITSHPKDWPPFQAYGRVLAASGVAAVTFNYRFASAYEYPTAAADVAALVEHLRANAGELGIDADRVGLWAYSGGGPQLAAAVRDRPAYVKCLVSFYAPLDLSPALERFSPLAALRASPEGSKATGRSLPPMFIARAGRDNPAINQSVDTFVREAKRRGAPVEVVEYAEGVHAFDIDQDTEESKKVIAQGIAFAKKHLVP